MQYFGTEIMRYYFGDKLWILTTYEQECKNMIISDLRFQIEFEESKKRGGKVIYIHRPECKAGSQASERELLTLYGNGDYDYLINNDGSLSDLFCKIKNISKFFTHSSNILNKGIVTKSRYIQSNMRIPTNNSNQFLQTAMLH